MIKDWAQFGGKEEDYDMISDCFGGESVGLDNDDETAGSPLTPPPAVQNITVDAGYSPSTSRIVGLKFKRSKNVEKPDFLTVMMM